jgi:hypothetical protein
MNNLNLWKMRSSFRRPFIAALRRIESALRLDVASKCVAECGTELAYRNKAFVVFVKESR